jgi:tRNA threonylcarbamoyladenosine biosynthesis protein TsaB
MLLAIDTSTAQIGLGLFDGQQVLAEYTWQSQAHHTRQLAPGVDELLHRAGISMENITAVGVATGPGSFTSLRVGLAYVKGLVLARHIPVMGIPTLDIIAAAIPPVKRIKLGAVLGAGRGRLALVWYHVVDSGWKAEGKPVVVTAEQLARQIHQPVIICGELTPEDRQRLARKFKNVRLVSPAFCVRRPAILAELAWKRWSSGKEDAAATLAPIYLHTASGPSD